MATDKQPGVFLFIMVFLLCALSVGMLWPVMLGYVDVSGVLIIALILNLSLSWSGTRFEWKKNIVFALLSVLLILTRRWYAYYLVGFFLAVIIALVADMIAKRTFAW